MDYLHSLSSNIISLVKKNKKLFVPLFRSYKLIINDIPWFEGGICSTVAPA